MQENSQLIEEVKTALGELANEVFWSINLPVAIVEAANIYAVAETIKDKLGFDMYLDVTAVDWHKADKPQRFELVLHFYSSKTFARVRVKSWIDEAKPEAPTLTTLYGSARFMERECHEMYGINFIGNDDLRPILLYEGFVGHPLRKDFPKNRRQPLVPERDPTIPYNKTVV